LPLVLTHAPAATSLNIFKQFMQEILHDGKFQAFDYGHLNSKKYGSTKPPIYDVSQITIPTYLLYGKKDKIGNEQVCEICTSSRR
jgi:poly(3-hydroxyalkanoate) synthetase